MESFSERQIQKKLQQHYRLKTVAKMCAVSEKTVRRWINEKRITAHRIGGTVSIPQSEFIKLINLF